MKKKQNEYWNKFYEKFNVKKASNFAKYLYKKNFISKKSKILEIGCGNGRDTFFFLKKNIKTIAIDKSYKAIKKNKKKIDSVFYCNDISKIDLKDINFYKKYKCNLVYARFFLHSLNFRSEKFFFDFCAKILPQNGKILLEFRTIKDPLILKGKKISPTERITDHYRRFIDPALLLTTIERKFVPIFMVQRFGLARFKKENPHVCRIILKKL